MLWHWFVLEAHKLFKSFWKDQYLSTENQSAHLKKCQSLCIECRHESPTVSLIADVIVAQKTNRKC